MNVVDRYSTRVAAYRRYRWDYAAEAVDALARACGLSANASVADVGSGTGMVSRHFLDRVRAVFAIEPGSDMRRVATETFQRHASFRSVEGRSDATTLADGSVQLIAVGRAIHWFPAASTRTEFCRILEPEGWLAIFSVPCTDPSLVQALRALHIPENGWDAAVDKEQLPPVPPSFYFGHVRFRTLTVAGSVRETWEEFLGRICSMAAAPGPEHPRRASFEGALRDVFESRANEGVIEVPNATQILFGRVSRQPSR